MVYDALKIHEILTVSTIFRDLFSFSENITNTYKHFYRPTTDLPYNLMLRYKVRVNYFILIFFRYPGLWYFTKGWN